MLLTQRYDARMESDQAWRKGPRSMPKRKKAECKDMIRISEEEST